MLEQATSIEERRTIKRWYAATRDALADIRAKKAPLECRNVEVPV